MRGGSWNRLPLLETLLIVWVDYMAILTGFSDDFVMARRLLPAIDGCFIVLFFCYSFEFERGEKWL